MQPWHWAMLALLPLLLGPHRLRTWAALMGASVAAHLLPAMSVEWYIAIDAVAGTVVMRHPVGCAQRAIGALFALMVLYSVGFMVADNPAGASVYLDAHTITGWVQWGCLAAWGLHDGGKALFDRARRARSLLAPREGF